MSRLFGLRRKMPAATLLDLRAVLIGLACVATAATARLLLEQVFPAVLPFTLTFPVVIVGTLLAGAGAGWIALVGCQLLTILFVLPHWVRDSGDRPQEIANLVLATLSLAIAVWATASYRRLSGMLRQQCEREVETLSLFIREMDHRTKNNFQIAASLLSTQSIAAERPEVREQLDVAASRLVSMASVYHNLSRREAGQGDVPLRAHLEQVAGALREGLLGPGVTLEVTGDEVEVKAASALTIGLVVNEWITNSAKYAFPGRGGHIRVCIDARPAELRIEVRDDGIGMDPAQARGMGSRLIANLVGALGGTTLVLQENGTRCVLAVPL